MRRQIEETAIIQDILPALFILLALQKSRFWMKLCFQSVVHFMTSSWHCFAIFVVVASE